MNHPEVEVLTLKAIAGDATVSAHDALARMDRAGVQESDFAGRETRPLFGALVSAMRKGARLELVSLLSAVGNSVSRALVVDVLTNWELGVSEQRFAVLREARRKAALLAELQALLGLARSDASYVDVHTKALQALTALDVPGLQLRPLDDSIDGLVDKLQAVQAGKRESTLATGIEALDYAIGGLQPTLTMVGALPGVGKSALFAAIARNLASRGVKVGVLSLEDEREWLAERILAEAASVPLFVLGNKPLTDGQMGRIADCAGNVGVLLRSILVDDTAAMTPEQVVASARSMVARGCRAVLVDHLGEIRLNRSERHDLDVLEALQDLRSIAKTHRVPVVVACHLRRREGLNTDAVPKLTDFAFSAAIERCARVALGLFRPRGEAPDEVMLGVEVLKQTKGPAGFNFKLNVGRLSGTVQATPVSRAMRAEFGEWRDE